MEARGEGGEAMPPLLDDEDCASLIADLLPVRALLALGAASRAWRALLAAPRERALRLHADAENFWDRHSSCFWTASLPSLQNFLDSTPYNVARTAAYRTHTLDFAWEVMRQGDLPLLASLLDRGHFPCLRRLDFGGMRVPDFDAAEIGRALRGVPLLCALRVNSLRLDGAAAADLLLHPSALTDLSLSFNPLGDAGMVHLAPRLSALTHLFLTSCRIGNAGLALLAPAVGLPLEFLALDHNPFGDAGMGSLASLLRRSRGLVVLFASYNASTAEGTAPVADALRSGASPSLKAAFLHVRTDALTDACGERAIELTTFQ